MLESLVVFGLVLEIVGFIMILRAEGKRHSTDAVVDAQYFIDPVKFIKHADLHRYGIIVVIVGIAIQIISILI